MENPELSKEKNLLEEMKEIISQSPKGIEEEFSRTANSWLACFAGHMDVVDTYLSLSKQTGLLSPDEYKKLDDKIENLKLKVFLLRKEYPDKDTIPPEDIKQELLKSLDIFQ